MVTPLTDKQKRDHARWNQGYSEGYNRRPMQLDIPEPYLTGYEVGKSDRTEDDEAIESGTFDLLNEEEREGIYGNEKDRI